MSQCHMCLLNDKNTLKIGITKAIERGQLWLYYNITRKIWWTIRKQTQLTSIISLFVLLSWGSLYSVYLSRTLSMSVLAYWNNLLALLKMMRAISQSHNTLSSYAFFMSPNFLFVNVTYTINKTKFCYQFKQKMYSCMTIINCAPFLDHLLNLYYDKGSNLAMITEIMEHFVSCEHEGL
jgi:hypothetical protein